MNLVPQNYYNQPQGLAGFFSWLRKAVNAVSKVVKTVSPTIGGWLDDFTNGDGMFFGIQFGSLIREERGFVITDQEIPLTQHEEVVLDSWVERKFIPFFTPYIEDIKRFITNPPKAIDFANYFNSTYQFLGVLKWYRDNVLNTGESGLSTNQLQARNEFIKKQIGDIEILVSRYLQTTGTTFNVVDQNITVTGSKYSSLGFNIPQVFNVQTKQIELSNANANEVLVSTSKPLVQNEVATSNRKKSNLLWFGIAGIGLWLATRKKRK